MAAELYLSPLSKSKESTDRHDNGLFHHVNPLAVRADPGWAVADTPFVLGKALGADLETAAAIPAESFALFAAVALKFFFPATGSLGFFTL
ncbi:hypothetical protein [Desulfobulbus alkaliphilus]|uniref:hypothetical protein n=1 Tax=Desulfobulbus alkaliphilus TaxID=869814 RepID=UPI001963386B|nr:hypothetical protein [Desulfobulbus alkaliphilus]MBM9535792.1 hypothetical protein [Desulfobulbus alkaliphilus]